MCALKGNDRKLEKHKFYTSAENIAWEEFRLETDVARCADHNFRFGRGRFYCYLRACVILAKLLRFFTTRSFAATRAWNLSRLANANACVMQFPSWQCAQRAALMCAQIRPYAIKHGTHWHKYRKNIALARAQKMKENICRVLDKYASIRHIALTHITCVSKVTVTTMIYLINHLMIPKTKI